MDRDLHKVQVELARLPKERAARRGDIDKLVGRANELRAQAKQLRVRIKEYEDVATAGRQRARKLENDMNAARADMSLQAHFQHEIKNVKREISNAEEQGLTLMEQTEGVDKEVATLQARIDAEEKVFAEFAANVEREMADAKARHDKLSAERQRRLGQSSIPPEAIATYSRLLAVRDGMPLAQLDGRTCQACYIEIPTNLVVRVTRGSELVPCPSCDRILYI